MKRTLLALFLLLILAPFALGLGPHELLVLVNGRSPDSVEIGKAFVRLRHVPARNVVRLDLPLKGKRSAVEMTPKAFSQTVWKPAQRAMKERGIEDHILAWVYSVDFPIRIGTKPPMSIQGVTFVKNHIPQPEVIRDGTYRTPIFAGPHQAGEGSHFPKSLDGYREWLQEDMPLPSMLLGYIGERGNTKEEIKRCLEKGVASDATAPTGTVYYVKSDDVRSRCRDWVFAPTRTELWVLGVHAVITRTFPAGAKDVMGLMMGAETVDPSRVERFLPGSMAEHLTSAAGMFDAGHQTKMSTWIKAGASTTAGTVTEPYANWAKFPNARFFVHYAAGCAALESYYQSIRCPLQIITLGDPLAQPWAKKAEMVMPELKKGEAAGTLEISLEIDAAFGERYRTVVFLLDGKTVAGVRESGSATDKRRRFVIPLEGLAKGKHSLRAVAYRTGLVRQQVFVEREFMYQ